MARPGEGGKGPTQSPAPTPESAESAPQATTPAAETGTKTKEADNKAKNAEIAQQIKDLDPNAKLNPEQMQWVQKQAAEQAKQEKPAETIPSAPKTEVVAKEKAQAENNKAKMEDLKEKLSPNVLEKLFKEYEAAKTPEEKDKVVTGLVNLLGERDRDRNYDRFGGKNLGAMRRFFAKEGDRKLDATTLAEAGGFKKSSVLPRWLNIAAKIGSGAAVAAMTLTGSMVPGLWGTGTKLGIQGGMEFVQQFKKGGGRERRGAELEVQAELTKQIMALKDLFEKNTEPSVELLKGVVAGIVDAEAKVIAKQKEHIISEQSERKWRTAVSTIATVSVGLLHGVPIGVKDYSHGTTHVMSGAGKATGMLLDKDHSVVKNIFGSKFVYNAGESERVQALVDHINKSRDALHKVKLTVGSGFFGSTTGFLGHATHELAAGLPASDRALLAKNLLGFGLLTGAEVLDNMRGVDQSGDQWKPFAIPDYAKQPPAPPTPGGNEPGGGIKPIEPKPPKPPVVKPVPPVVVKPPIPVEPPPVPPVTTGPEGAKPPGTETEAKTQTELDRLTELAEQKKPMDLDTALQVLRIVDKSPTAEPEGFHKDRDQYLALDRKGQTRAIAMGFDTMQQIYHPSNASEADPVKKAAFEKIYSIIEDAKKFLDNERPIEQVTDKELELLEKFALEKPFGGNTMDADTALQALRIVTEDPAVEPDKFNEAKARFYALDSNTQKSVIDNAFTSQFLRYQNLGKAPGKIQGVFTDSERFLKQDGVYASKVTNQEANPAQATEEAISQEQGAITQPLPEQGAVTQPLPIEQAAPTQPLPVEAPPTEPAKSNVTQLPKRNPSPPVADQQDQLAA